MAVNAAPAFTLSVDDLEALVGRKVREAIGELETRLANEIMTRAQVAELLQVHPVIVGRYVKSKGLPARKVGPEWRFKRSEVLRWLDQQKPANEAR